MNLLIIGNGFDLAHGLPTRYTDFLKYCQDYDESAPVSEAPERNEEFSRFRRENVWLSYFLKITPELEKAGTWIDFEKEIAEAVGRLEEIGFRSWPDFKKGLADCIRDLEPFDVSISGKIDSRDVREEKRIRPKICILGREILDKYGREQGQPEDTDVMVQLLYRNLRQFARAFELYCLKVDAAEVEKPVSCERKDELDEILRKAKNFGRLENSSRGYTNRREQAEAYHKKYVEEMNRYRKIQMQVRVNDYLSLSQFHYVLSFNYTDTYERLYGDADTKYCYIHGKAQADPEKTALIFGMDDDLAQGKESSDFKWVSFKKYYQRIIYRTGSEYKDWLSVSPDNREAIDCVYIAGHSLDRTDWDILYEIFSNSRFKITVYYYNQKDFEDKVQKVIQLLACRGANGRDELIRRVHGSGWSIRFVDQYDEKEGLFVRPQPQRKTEEAQDEGTKTES